MIYDIFFILLSHCLRVLFNFCQADKRVNITDNNINYTMMIII